MSQAPAARFPTPEDVRAALTVVAQELPELAARSDDELRSDFAVIGGVQHYLLLLVESVLDLGSHVISSESYDPPPNYPDIFRVLRDEGILPAELADRLMAMARFRNVLVHLYADVDEDRVLRVLREALGEPDAFVTLIRERFAEQLES